MNEKLHDLASLLNFDSMKVSGEMLGEEPVSSPVNRSSRNIGCQVILLSLPEDNMQCLLLAM